jgi:hypothetical protein
MDGKKEMKMYVNKRNTQFCAHSFSEQSEHKLRRINSLESKLNEIYNPVGISWNITADEYNYSGKTNFLDEKSKLLSSYPDLMKNFNNEYGSNRNIDDKTAYLFFFNQYGAGTKDRDADGFMPRDKQFGYIFTQGFPEEDRLYIAAAHELGHGVFRLEHTFSSDYKVPQFMTNNLMDYTNGTHIAKWQWDLIHDPGVVVRVFEKDKDAMDISTDSDYEWVLEIYSPMISEKFIDAKDHNDYYEMRRLTYYALQNTFSNDWNERVTLVFD